jgi:hypothetical protein
MNFRFSLSIYDYILCRLFTKRPKTTFVLRKNKLYHKENRMNITDFYVARKWFYAVLKIIYTKRSVWKLISDFLGAKLVEHLK